MEQLKSYKGSEIGLKKKNSNLFRERSKKGKNKINVKNFNKVISIDSKNRIVEVEGMTTFDDFVKETLKYGFMPLVVPQLKSITIGGAVSGIGIESSSFRYGLVHETVEEMEVLLSNGETITCTPKNKHRDLFHALPNSYGTLGYILKLKVKLIPVKQYVALTHIKYNNTETYFKDMKKFCLDNKNEKKSNYDFIDGTIFNEKEMYLTLGKFMDFVPKTSDYKFMNIYFKSIQKNKIDYLKTKDYIWRWDPDWFWGSRKFGMQNPLIRFLLGKFMLNSYAYWKIIALDKKLHLVANLRKIKFLFGKKQGYESIVQDVGIPTENSAKFIKFFTKTIGIFPIWVCPYQSFNKKSIFPLFNLNPSKTYVDFGFWDTIKSDKQEGYYNRLVEKKVKELKGDKSLYSESFYSEKEFWQAYNGEAYCKVKRKYDSENKFKNLYQKCVKKR